MAKPRLLGLSAEEATRRVAIAHLESASKALARVHDDEDLEALHAVRVSIRKLRSHLRAYERILGKRFARKSRDRLKRLTVRTNPGRDAEVQLGWVRSLSATGEDGLDGESLAPGVQWIEARLEARRADAYQDIRAQLEKAFGRAEAKLRDGLEKYTVTFRVGEESPLHPFHDVAADAIEAQLSVLLEDLRGVHSIADEERAHDARIHGKRLRYLLEPLRKDVSSVGANIKELKALQDLLGDLNDLHNLTITLGEALEANAIAQARRLREAATEGYADIAKELAHDERPGLLALLGRVQTDRRRLFDSLLFEWLREGARLDELAHGVRHTAAAMRGGASVSVERSFFARRR